MFRHALIAFSAASVLAVAPAAATAASVFGSLGNFDAVNDTGKTAHGFEIELEGLHASDILDTFGGPGRGFPPDVERYGAPVIQEYSNGATFGVRIIYRADLTGDPSAWVGTPSGVYNTPGESCWTGGGSGYGPSTPCDHFGVSTIGNPTKTTYNWLVEDTPGSSNLVLAGSNVLAPVWTVTPAAPPPPGQPPAPPVVAALIQAPEADMAGQWGDAIWVKVFTTEFADAVDLRELVNDNAKVQAAETEIEWQLLQRDPGNPLSGILENGDAGPVGAGMESVLRRYEFYKYAGAVNPEDGEARPTSDSSPADWEIGAFIGDQMAAVNFGIFAAAVPEPATWVTMIVGFFGLGAVLRRSRRRSAALS